MIDKNTGVWDLDTAKRRHRFDKPLADYIIKNYKVNSIADVGCGVGSYCKAFKDSGINIVHGYEGTQGISKIATYDDIMTVDLTKERWVDIYYDLVICLEVGEHIPLEYEQRVIDNICRYVNKDLILSWAVPGQGGAGHYNERPNEYIIAELGKRGFVFNKVKSMNIREAASLKWFRNTLMIFERV